MSNKSSVYIPEVFWESCTASTRSRLVALWVDADSYSRKLCSYSLAIRLPFALPPRIVSWLLYFSTSPRTTASWQSKKICTCSWAFFSPLFFVCCRPVALFIVFFFAFLACRSYDVRCLIVACSGLGNPRMPRRFPPRLSVRVLPSFIFPLPPCRSKMSTQDAG